MLWHLLRVLVGSGLISACDTKEKTGKTHHPSTVLHVVLQELGGLVAEGSKTPKEEFDAYLQAVADDMRNMDYSV
jgi:hypothetical protein